MRELVTALSIRGRVDPSVGRATRQARADMRQLGDAVGTSTREARTHANRLGGAVRAMRADFAKTGEARRLGRALADLQREKRQTTGQTMRLDNEIEDLQRRYDSARRAALGYEDSVERVGRASDRTADRQAALQSRMGKMRAAGLAAAAGMALAGREALKDEQAVTELGSVFNGAREGETGQQAAARSRLLARAYARDMDNMADARELLQVEYEMHSTGLGEEVARVGARLGHELATVTRGSAEEVAKTVGGIYNTLGQQMEGDAEARIGRISNILAQTQLQYQLSNFAELGAGFQFATASASGDGVSTDQTASILGFLNSNQVKGSRAGTAFNAMMRSLGKASDELGFTLQRDADDNLDLIGTLGALKSSLDGMGVDERNGTLQRIFGDEGKAAVAPILANYDALIAGHERLVAAVDGDVLSEKYDEFVDSASGSLKQLGTSLRDLGSGVGGSALGVMEPVVGGLTRAANAAGAFIDTYPVVGRLIGASIVAVGLLGAGLFGVAAAQWAWNFAKSASMNVRLLGYIGRLTALTKTHTVALVGQAAAAGSGGSKMGLLGGGLRLAAGGVRALGVALMTTPIGLIIGGIALGGLLIYKYWKPIRAFFKGLWSEIGPPLTAFGDFIGKVVRRTPGLRVLGFAFRQVGRVVRWIGSLFTPVETGLDRAEDAGARFGRVLKAAFSISPIGMLIRGVKQVQGAFERVAAVLRPIGELIESIASAPERILDAGKSAAKRATALLPGGRAVSAVGSLVANDNDDERSFLGRLGSLFGRGQDEDEAKASRPGAALQAANDRAAPPAANDSARSEALAQAAAAGGDSYTFNLPGVMLDADTVERELMPAIEEAVARGRRGRLHD